MNPILSGTEAFNAMMAGKHVMCRPIGDMLDFDELDQFPATIFAKADYEFCLKLEMMEVSGIRFTKPLNAFELNDGQEIFIVQPTCVVHTKYDATNAEIQNSLLNGFVQADEDNAKLQLQAIADLFGRVVAHPVVKTAELKTRKTRTRKVKTDTEVDAPNSTSFDVEEKTTMPAEEAAAVQPISIKPPVPAEDPEFQNLLSDLLNRAATATTPTEATALTSYTKTWSEAQRKPLLDAIHKRLNELNPPERAEAKEPPSLMVQIQNAKDLTELDCLEIEVSTRHVDIQPKLMGCVKRRRFELENQGSEVRQ
ncbi:hypothetical protein [Acinetobacter entericus]|uniref:DUF2589 domain-containing protein n=1 Tax=Acinetobacter entericus TaxID=2989714 RepID=A0ABT3NKH3_9GAMM|nr:hypothetical protein [Acinetobacter entericus]MCW8040051.1 hypothetical protein [Acinetobacter entericus]